MLRTLTYIFILTAAILLQVTILPSFIADPFKPNLLIIVVTWLGLKKSRNAGFLAFALGIIQDCYSGIYLGLDGFSYLCLFIILNAAADRLYTESRFLMVFVVFLATVVNGLINLLLLLLFSTASGIYATLLADLIPQALANSLISALLFSLPRLADIEENV
jgi:rod shape-determining protein MreD